MKKENVVQTGMQAEICKNAYYVNECSAGICGVYLKTGLCDVKGTICPKKKKKRQFQTLHS